MSNHKKEKKEEFNIPIKIFGKKKKEESQENDENDIVPVMISKEDARGNKASEERENKKEGEKKVAWAKRKNEAERRKIMWVVVVCFMVVIISVWAIFLKYNILLENLSIKQTQRDEEWSKIKDNFDQSYQNFENIVEEYNKEDDAKIGTSSKDVVQSVATSTEAGTEVEKNKVDISKEDIEKLKEKIIEKK